MREVLTQFGGQIPRQTDFGLPSTFAVRATNVKLQSGEIRGIHALTQIHDFANSAIQSAYRIPASPADLWLGFESPYGVVIRSPLVSDTLERYYWHEPGEPIYYNTKARIAAGNTGANAPYLLGVPAPANAPDVTPTGGTALTVTRAYLYTWVTGFGEEGPPSLPTLATAFDDATWTIDNFDVAVPGAAQRNVTAINIYRTVTSITGTAEYFFVAQIPIATTSYADVDPDLLVAGRGQNLESTLWFPPPDDLEGIAFFPGGVILGWRDNTVFMSVPYRPHAWPPIYQVATEYPIVGIGVTGNTAVLCTQGSPAAITMTTPDTASMQKIEAAEPCLARGTIVGSPEGVYYASQNGLMFFGPGGFNNVTQQLISKEEWLQRYSPELTKACRYQTQYIGLTQPGTGYVLDGSDPRLGFVELAGLSGASMIMTDAWSGEVFLISAGLVFKWDDADTDELVWRWASKRFLLPYEANIGAVRLTLKPADEQSLPAKPALDAWGALFALTPGGTGAANAIPATPPTWAAFTLRVYANGCLVQERYVRDSKTIKLQSGIKVEDWQFEIVGNKPLVKFELAETAKELAQV